MGWLKDFKYKREVIAVLAVFIAAVALFQTYVPLKCTNFDCFQIRMQECKPATFINDEPEASWGYRIRGIYGDSCRIDVILLNAKEGELGLRKYERNSMACYYERGVIAYPEKNLDYCHGQLKENLQTVLIEKLYKYIVANLGEIRDELLVNRTVVP